MKVYLEKTWGKMSTFKEKASTWSKGPVRIANFLWTLPNTIEVHYIDIMNLSLVLKTLFLAGKHYGEKPLLFNLFYKGALKLSTSKGLFDRI